MSEEKRQEPQELEDPRELEDLQTVRATEDLQRLAEQAGHPWEGWTR